MRHDFRPEAVDVAPDGWYEVLIIDGKTDVTRDGNERWRMKYEIKGVIDTKQTALALNHIGKELEDVLIDMDKDFWRRKIKSFMRAAFPECDTEAQEAGEDYEAPDLSAENCVGRRMGVQISIVDGDPKYDDAAKVNKCWRFKKIGEPANPEEESGSDDSLDDVI